MRAATVFRLASRAPVSAGLLLAGSKAPALLIPCRTASRGKATSSRIVMASAEVQQQGQSFSQLKDASKETTEVVFDPFEQGQEQLVAVDKGKLNSPKVEEGLARVLFHPSSEAAINEQINHELTMSYVYTSVASYFNRDNVALSGFRDYFKNAAAEERDHAQLLMDYQASRGGRVKLATLTAPQSDFDHEEKGDALYAMEIALAMERLNLQYLYKLHEVADNNRDPQMADFVEVMLEEQVNGVKEAADFVSKLRRVGKGLGVYQLDAATALTGAKMSKFSEDGEIALQELASKASAAPAEGAAA